MGRRIDSELLISWSLKIGIYTSAAIIIIGMAMFFITGNSGYPANSFPTTIAGVWSGVVTFKSSAIAELGLLCLILTPVFRVFASVFVFLLERDFLYMSITLFVLAILIFSLVFGKAI